MSSFNRHAAMIYLRSVVTGMISAVCAATVWVLVAFVLPLWLPMLMSRFGSDGGVGASSAYIISGSILVAALVGFVLGFSWQFRRATADRGTGPRPDGRA